MINYADIKEKSVKGRYVTHIMIADFLNKLPTDFKVELIGASVLNNPIKAVKFGNGPLKILMWSQMHGNESTTTKASLDLLNFLSSNDSIATEIKEKCTLLIIPILNPDGALAYTRVNANKVDLNRDAQDLSQPESVVLKKIYNEFKPDFCFNLHGQRTIFNVGTTPKSATISFLAPAYDVERNVSPSRKVSMQLIVAMNNTVQEVIPNQVGRYDDGFNSNCVGDAFQMLNTPTILFEAGHYENDYDREITRAHIFTAILTGVKAIYNEDYMNFTVEDYTSIPENGKFFFDILIRNANLFHDSFPIGSSVGILYKEVLENEEVKFIPTISQTGNLNEYYGHRTYNCSNTVELSELCQLKNVSVLLGKMN